MARRYRFRFKSMDVYRAAVEHFAWTVGTVGRLARGPFVISNQVIGASLSIVGNVAEANGRGKEPGEVEQHYRYAQGSTFESASHLDALSALGVVDDDEYNAAEERLNRIAAMLSRLMQHQRLRRTRGSSEKRGSADKRGSAATEAPGRAQRPAAVVKPATAGLEKGGSAATNPSKSRAPRGVEKPASAGVEKRGPKARASTHPTEETRP